MNVRIPKKVKEKLVGSALMVAMLVVLSGVAGVGSLQAQCVDYGAYPDWVGSVDTPGGAWGVAVVDGYAYVADHRYGLQVIDISTPGSPQVVGSVDTPGEARGVAVLGSYAYVADGSSGLQVIDISVPGSPRIVGSVDTPGEAYNVVVEGGYAYVADGRSGLQVIDTSTPSAPQILGSVDTPSIAYGVAVLGSYAYVADYRSGLQVIDISTPDSPQVVGSVATPGEAHDVLVLGGYAYVADMHSGLQVIDVSTPSLPRIVGGVDTPSYARGVAVAGGYAYVADCWSGLQVIDISMPSLPQIVGSVDTPGEARDVVVLGGYAYVADFYAGLQVIDIATPSSPQMVGGVDTPDDALDVVVLGGYAYVADQESGLQVIDISTPISPQIVGGLGTPDMAYGVAVLGGCVYVADWESGLQIAPAQCEDFVTVTFPNGGETLEVGENYDITWVAFDGLGVDSVSISYSVDGGDSFSLIASGEANDGTYSWTIPDTPTDSALMKVMAYDPNLNVGEDVSDGLFAILEPPDEAPPELTISVHQNPELTWELDIYLVPSEALQDTSVWLSVNDSKMVVVPSDTLKSIYTCSYHLSRSGPKTIDAHARDLVGNQADTSRTFGAGLVAQGQGGSAPGPFGRVMLSCPAYSVKRDTYVLVLPNESTNSAGSEPVAADFVLSPPVLRLDRPARLTVKLDTGDGWPKLWRDGSSGWQALESSYNEATGTLSALIQDLGRYRVTWHESDGATAAVGLLLRTAPNPFRTTVGVRYHLPAGNKVRLAVYDVTGRKVRTLVDTERGPGWHSENWDGKGERGNSLPGGVYFTVLEAGPEKISRKCVLVR